MSVRIRLRRMGRKKLAHFRIVVADSAAPRDGRFVETLGYYKPLTSPARLVVDLDKADEWIRKGAEQSDTVRTLLNKARKGGDGKVALGEIDREEAKAAKAAEEEPAAEEKAEPEPEAAEEEPAAEAEAESEAKAVEDEPAAEAKSKPKAKAAKKKKPAAKKKKKESK